MRAVQFDTGNARLQQESRKILNQIADIMAKYPSYGLNINGHTDSQGQPGANLRLSERRAKSCYYLVNRGVSTTRLNFAGYGETKPISDNNTLRGRALNRRVEFQLNPL